MPGAGHTGREGGRAGWETAETASDAQGQRRAHFPEARGSLA